MHKCDECNPPKLHNAIDYELKTIIVESITSVKGNENEIRECCKNAMLPEPTKEKLSKLIKGCVGLPISLIELLWCRCYMFPAKSKIPNYKECVQIDKIVASFNQEISKLELNINNAWLA